MNELPADVKENKGIANALAETRKELRKVQWPKKKELINYTWIVLSSVIVVSLIIYAIDYALGWVIQQAIAL